jgi:hypothetical protein
VNGGGNHAADNRGGNRLHHFAHAYILKSPLAEQAGSLLHNALVFPGVLFGEIAHNLFCIRHP